MALLYLDTSALIKLYVREEGTVEMLKLAHPDAGNRLAILSLSRIEFGAAIRCRTKLGDIDAHLADELIRSFGGHLSRVFQIQPLNEAVLESAASVVDRYALCAYDAVQLGGYLTLRATVGGAINTHFVCADCELLEAARLDGLTTINIAVPKEK